MLLASLLRWLDQTHPADEAPDTPPMVELVLEEQKGSGATTAPPTPVQDQPAPVPASSPPAPEASQSAPQAARTAPSPPLADQQPSLPPPLPSPDAEKLPQSRAETPATAASSADASATVASPARPEVAPPPAPAPAPTAAPGPELNLGGTDSLTNATARGPDVIPAKVDAHWRNREPVYPPAAAVRGEHGMVLLLVHVAADGLAAQVDVAQSSGFALLDRSAREAIGTWHFLPALKDGQPVPFEVPLRVVFRLD